MKLSPKKELDIELACEKWTILIDEKREVEYKVIN
jgi:hypothetical protein